MGDHKSAMSSDTFWVSVNLRAVWLPGGDMVVTDWREHRS
jgi:hypothetical protein